MHFGFWAIKLQREKAFMWLEERVNAAQPADGVCTRLKRVFSSCCSVSACEQPYNNLGRGKHGPAQNRQNQVEMDTPTSASLLFSLQSLFSGHFFYFLLYVLSLTFIFIFLCPPRLPSPSLSLSRTAITIND